MAARSNHNVDSMSQTILVASATANTGSKVVELLSAAGSVAIRALVRNPSAASAQSLSSLPNVTVVKGDFDDPASIKAALQGVSRAFLVSSPGEDIQYDREVIQTLLLRYTLVLTSSQCTYCMQLCMHSSMHATHARAYGTIVGHGCIFLTNKPCRDMHHGFLHQCHVSYYTLMSFPGGLHRCCTRGWLRGSGQNFYGQHADQPRGGLRICPVPCED